MSLFNAEELKLLQSAKNLIARKARSKARIFTSPQHTKDYLLICDGICEPSREEFKVLYLDNQHRLIADETLFQGTIDASPVYPRVVVQRALHHNAAAVIFAHNHPSGVAEPSRADKAITERLVNALRLVDINVLDHFVVGDTSCVSFAERGWI